MNSLPQRAYLETIAKSLPDPLFVTDCSQKVIWFSDKAREIFGPETEKGRSLHEITGLDKLQQLLEEVLSRGEPLECSYEGATIKVKHLEKKYFFKVAINPIFYEGKLRGALVQLTDVTRFYEMEKIKSDFVSIVSHEFRTPLTTILMGTEMLRKGLLGEITPRGKEILEAIDQDCSRLTRLVDNLLELSRIESGTIYLEQEAIDVAGLVQEAVRPLSLQAEKKGVRLVVDLPDHLPTIYGDFNKVVWILTNLVGNALRYTEAGGSITVKVRHRGNRLFFSVQDTGCGIPRQYQDKLFRKYVQVRSKDRAAGGAGLGLAICKEIVVAHGGEIWVESEEGNGSTFTFTMPLYRQEEEI
ncbi:MAG: PAS domain-containing sensor histidine kinase [Dethiobacteria bacterium]